MTASALTAWVGWNAEGDTRLGVYHTNRDCGALAGRDPESVTVMPGRWVVRRLGGELMRADKGARWRECRHCERKRARA